MSQQEIAPHYDDREMAEFKQWVDEWMQADEQIKKLREVLRERNGIKQELTGKILDFMARYNIEDLNTQAGKLRFKLLVVKEPLSQQGIKDRVARYFGETNDPGELNNRIFSERATSTKATLRRLPGPKRV